MGLAGKTAKAIRFLFGHRLFEGEVLEREYRDVGSFKFPVTLYNIRVRDNGRLLHLSEEGHTKHFESGNIIRDIAKLILGLAIVELSGIELSEQKKLIKFK